MGRELSLLGRLIEDGRARLGISGREAARRANITEARWRQVVRGTQTRAGGERVPANPKPVTVVAMALAVEVDPSEALRTAGLDASPTAVEKMAAQIREPAPDDLDELLVVEIERVQRLPLGRGHKLRIITALVDTYEDARRVQAGAVEPEQGGQREAS